MATYQLAQRARIDLSAIGRFTRWKWGEAQADRYLEQLERDLELLASRPEMGTRLETDQSSTSRRFQSGSHIFFYKPEGDSIVVGRILHKRMLVKKHGS